jgi:hypothetical protein
MVDSVTLTLQPQKQSSFYRMEMLVQLLHAVTFIILAVKNYPQQLQLSIFGLLVIIAFFIINKKQQQPKILPSLIPFSFFVVWWCIAGVYWMALLLLAFNIFAMLSKQKIQIIFSAQQIIYKAFPSKKILWASLNNVVLKDGLLTIDFKNDKLLQQPVEEQQTSENDFNAFCQQQLTE